MRYIDADKLIQCIDNCADMQGDFGSLITVAKEYAKNITNAQPTADVRENVRGHWNKYKFKTANYFYKECSECGWIEAIETNFCPNCGADMRGGYSPKDC